MFSPNLGEAPALQEDNHFAITCAVEGCGEAFPIFRSTSQLAVVTIVNDLVTAGVYQSSACLYECDRVLSRHALNRETYTQLLTTSTLSASRLSYGRLTAAQDATVDTRPSSISGFALLEAMDKITDVSMEECHAYMEIRKLIVMHAVWLADDTLVVPATGTCNLFFAARDKHQETLWKSFFEYANSIADVGHFRNNVLSDTGQTAIVRPSSGLDCDPSLQETTAGGGIDDRTEWRACLWWSEFSHDQQNEYSCSPDRVRYILNPFSTF